MYMVAATNSRPIHIQRGVSVIVVKKSPTLPSSEIRIHSVTGNLIFPNYCIFFLNHFHLENNKFVPQNSVLFHKLVNNESAPFRINIPCNRLPQDYITSIFQRKCYLKLTPSFLHYN